MYTTYDSETLENISFTIISPTSENCQDLRVRSHDQNHMQKMERLKQSILMSNFCSEMFNIIYLFGCRRSNMFDIEFKADHSLVLSPHSNSLHHPQRHQAVCQVWSLLSSYLLYSSLTHFVFLLRSLSLLRVLIFPSLRYLFILWLQIGTSLIWEDFTGHLKILWFLTFLRFYRTYFFDEEFFCSKQLIVVSWVWFSSLPPNSDRSFFRLPQWLILLIVETMSPIFLLPDFKRWMPITSWASLVSPFQGLPGRTWVFPNSGGFSLSVSWKSGLFFSLPPQFLKLWILCSTIWVICSSVWTSMPILAPFGPCF